LGAKTKFSLPRWNYCRDDQVSWQKPRRLNSCNVILFRFEKGKHKIWKWHWKKEKGMDTRKSWEEYQTSFPWVIPCKAGWGYM
jgi:hypothetical protein